MLAFPGFIFLGLYLYFDSTFLAVISIIILGIGLFPLLAGKDSWIFIVLFLITSAVRSYFFPQRDLIDTTLYNLAVFNSLFIVLPWILFIVGLPIMGIFSFLKKDD